MRGETTVNIYSTPLGVSFASKTRGIDMSASTTQGGITSSIASGLGWGVAVGVGVLVGVAVGRRRSSGVSVGVGEAVAGKPPPFESGHTGRNWPFN